MKPPDKVEVKRRGYVAVIGGANLDIHGKSTKKLLPKDSNPGTVHFSAGGVARNVAENLTRLGVDCRLISAIGKDHHGQVLMQLCREAGIDMQYVREFASAPTSTYLSVLDDTGEMHVAVNDMRIIENLSAERLQQHQAMLENASLTILDANLPADALAWLADTLASNVVFADTVSAAKAPRLKPILNAIHTLKTSPLEVEALTGLGARTQTQLRAIASQLHADGVQRVFITRGDQGVFYSTGDVQDVKELKRNAHDVHNAGGAGDAFLAGLAYAWLEDWPLDESLQFALAAAELTLSHPASSNPALSLAAVTRVLETQGAG